jgi:putative ABC transport system permease protein
MNAHLLINYVRIALRRVRRKTSFAIISISGLALAVAASLVIADYVAFERGFDRFHDNTSRIYRVTTEWNKDTSPGDIRATTVQWSGPGVHAIFPEVEAFSRVMPISRMTGLNAVQYEGKGIDGQDILLADPGFFRVFSFTLLEGDVRTALSEPRSVIISESLARTHFGYESPLGKGLVIDTHGNLNGNDFKVTGVIADAPPQSHLQYDFLISFSSMWEGLNNGSTYWHWDNTYCYLLLKPNTDPTLLAGKMTERRVKEFSSEMTYYKDKIDFHLQPLVDVHLNSSLKGEMSIHGNARYLDFLVILAICIVLSACINYVNLSLAATISRQAEIGIRKISGSSVKQLLVQLSIEAMIVVSISIAVGVVIGWLSIPLLESSFGVVWPAPFPASLGAAHLCVIGGIFITLILLSLGYPAMLLQWISPSSALKGNGGIHGATMKQHLVVAQFAFCICFTIATFVLLGQMKFIRSHDPGFERDHVVVVSGYGFYGYDAFENFKAVLSSSHEIVSIGMSSAAPGDEIVELSLRPRVWIEDSGEHQEAKLIMADEGFFQTLGIPLVTGRGFDRLATTEKNSVIINETMARMLGFENPADIIGEGLNGVHEGPATIIGVIRNYHQRSFHKDYEPAIYIPSWAHSFGWDQKSYFIKVRSNEGSGFARPLRDIELAWRRVLPSFPFSYFFLDEHVEREYKADDSFVALFTLFSGFALAITLVGLLGVVAHVALNRTREIAVRKVLGATITGILLLLSRDFIKLMVIASLIAFPIAYIAATSWLQTFAFRIELNALLMVAPVAAVVVITVAVIVIRSARVASTNPVEGLRHE